MDKIVIAGGNRLSGDVKIGGSKNASLGVLAASILNKNPVHLLNVSNVVDTSFMMNLLMNLGGRMTIDAINLEQHNNSFGVLIVDNSSLSNDNVDYDFVSKMRASIFTLGPILGRFGNAHISLPGGCAIGVRPVDLYTWALEQMGAIITLQEGYIAATTNGKKLKGAVINFPSISNGATQCVMCAAVFAQGQTIINNASEEPEVVAVAEFLNACGAKISGFGTSTITIEGVETLHECTYKIPSDRIEAGTYAIIAAVTNSELRLTNCPKSIFDGCIKEFDQIGVGVERIDDNSVRCFKSKDVFQTCNIQTAPYPGFPTDMQAQIMSTLCLTQENAVSTITENIFENRFMHVAELYRMGAKISVHNNTATIYGIKKFQGANVMATDLRASVALIIAGLVADGTTTLNRVYHLDRGYNGLVSKLKACGADINRVR
ncbi:MAG: UDP-N-acetylglucosamine 1-carboxyvinyltransferase [Pseudomonadota bacterium]|jgi:UDP-N-acetylglucosamine 1-carboxyvinyltransferase